MTTPAPDSDSRSFLRSETFGAGVLLAATAGALVWANWPGATSYQRAWDGEVHHWLNDWLMAVFFLLIGLEIKRELVHGALRDRRAAMVPLIAAVGGMVVPALVFTAVLGAGAGRHAWGVPMATDVAFVVGVLAVLGRRAPTGLRAFLLTLAVADDIGAIVVIAIFYAGGLFHPTLVAVALGLAFPTRARWLERIEGWLHPWSSLVVVPLFALANAGVRLDGAGFSRLTWAVVVGLVVGKTAGIWSAAWAARRFAGGRLPAGVEPAHLFGGAVLGGIGFTVSLFVADLALPSAQLHHAKIGVLAGSAASAVLGAAILVVHARRPRPA
ncbi:MAG: Na+:H+ antiporter, NhaA family [Actinomycetota bacterium]